MRPNFSRVRLKKNFGRTGAPSHSRKKKSPRLRKSLCCSTTDTLVSYRGLNQSEIVKGGPPPLIGCGPDIPVCVCVCVWRCVCCCCQTEREVSSRDARSSFSESALFSERLTVSPGFCDRWIYRKIKQTPLFSKLPQILRLDASCDVIAMRIQSKKGCFSVPKMEWTALRSHHARFTRATSDKRTESGTNPRYSFGLQTVYLLGPALQAALDHATPLYTALGDTVKKVDSITSLSNLVRSIQIRHRIMLKLQTSEQTPLMWKPG